MAYSGKYKPAKGLGKPKNIKEAKAVERRLALKYPGQKEKHAEAIKAAAESGLTKLAKKVRRKLKGKKAKTVRTKAISSGLKRAKLTEQEIARFGKK